MSSSTPDDAARQPVLARVFGPLWRSRLPEVVRWLLIIGSIVLALGAAVAPLVFLLRRTGVG